MWNLFVYKRNEEENEIQQIWQLAIFHTWNILCIESFQIEQKKREMQRDVWSLSVSVWKKILFVIKSS